MVCLGRFMCDLGDTGMRDCLKCYMVADFDTACHLWSPHGLNAAAIALCV